MKIRKQTLALIAVNAIMWGITWLMIDSWLSKGGY